MQRAEAGFACCHKAEVFAHSLPFVATKSSFCAFIYFITLLIALGGASGQASQNYFQNATEWRRRRAGKSFAQKERFALKNT